MNELSVGLINDSLHICTLVILIESLKYIWVEFKWLEKS